MQTLSPFHLVTFALVGLAFCTPAERQTAGTVLTDVSAAAPVSCSVLSATGVKVGTACGSVATDVSDVAKLVSDVLATLPAEAPAATDPAAPAFTELTVRGVRVTVPTRLAAPLRAALAARGAL